MRLSVARLGQPRALGLTAGAALACSFACGSSSSSGLFGGTAGRPSAGASGIAGASGVGGLSNTGGNESSSGGLTVGGSATAAGASAVAGTSGNAVGGNAVGGNAVGGNAVGGNAVGGNAVGGNAVGGNTSAGALPGGSTAGGASSGGQANGGNAGAAAGTSVGGSTSGGGMAGGAGGSGGGDCAVSSERCDGIDNDCNDSVDDNACPAKCTGFELSGQGYMVCNANVDASKAASVCEAQGLRLAWIESAEENTALLQTIDELNQSSGRGGGILEVHIGASDSAKEGRWQWVGGSDFWLGGAQGEPVDGAYANWAQGRPNGAIGELLGSEDCAVFVIDQANDGEPGEWNDVDCENGYGVLCEQP